MMEKLKFNKACKTIPNFVYKKSKTIGRQCDKKSENEKFVGSAVPIRHSEWPDCEAAVRLLRFADGCCFRVMVVAGSAALWSLVELENLFEFRPNQFSNDGWASMRPFDR